MRRRERRRQAAADASLLLVQEALVAIRTMAYLRQDLAAGDGQDEPPGDYHERIRLIADVCHNLPGYLRTSSPGTAAEGLQYVWDTASPAQRQWLRDTLAHHGLVITDLVVESGAPTPPPPRGGSRLPVSRQAAIMLGRWPVRTPRGEQPLPPAARVLKAVDTQELCALYDDRRRLRLGLGKGSPWLRAHLDPTGTHYLVPDPADYYWPSPAGKVPAGQIPIRGWQCSVLLRMVDGQQVKSMLSVLPERFSALPDNVPRREQLRLFHLIRATRYHTYLWGQDHKAACSPQQCGYSPDDPAGDETAPNSTD
jgi:hypothetical protein